VVLAGPANLIHRTFSRERMTSKDGADGSTVQSGDLVQLEYDLWAELAGKPELVDTTHEEVAQTAGVHVPQGRTWGPRPHEVGGEGFPAGIEKSLVGLKVGEEVEREYAPGDAFGERDPNLIELFTMHEVERLPEMRREDAHLDLGTILTINGRRGRVVTLTAARVRVDFNPPFSGRKVRAKFRVVGKIADPAERVRAIVELQYGYGSEFHVEHREKAFTLRVPDRTKFDPFWVAAKARIVERVRQQLHPESIRFLEEWVTPVEPKKPAEEKKSAAPHAGAATGAAEPAVAESKPAAKRSTSAPKDEAKAAGGA
jgi:FKBP-type peptidyl-prolyl cis-trans isomerase 2